MREIKFRGLTPNGEWVYGSLVTANAFIKHMPKQHTKTWIITSAFGNGGWFNIRGRKYVKPETVGQFTDMQDEQGGDIYEGDRVKHENGRVGTVEFINGHFETNSSVNVFDQEAGFDSWDCKVIGNIHQQDK